MFGALIVFLLMPIGVWTEAAQDAKPNKSLPGYYQFYEKAGAMVRIEAEIERDERIESGDLEPVYVGKAVDDLYLPDGFGNVIGLRDYIGKKNVVLTTFRTWW